MKKTNFKILLGLAVASIVTVGCKGDDIIIPDDTPKADKVESVNQLIKILKDKPQEFYIRTKDKDTVIIGKDSTIIKFPKGSIKDTLGNPIDSVKIELNEYLSLNNMLLNNIQTSSNGKLLITGGSFDLNVESMNGSPVVFNPFSVSSSFPVKLEVPKPNDMEYYVGERTINNDGKEIVDWELSDNAEFFMTEDNLFNVFGIRNGLTNCDVLYEIAANNPTQFEASVAGVTDYSKATVWLFIKDFPSAVMLTQKNIKEDALKTYENSIPKGLNGVLLAITTDAEGYLKFGKKEITVEGDDTFDINVEYGTKDKLKELINTL